MNVQKMDETIKKAKRFLNAYSPPREKSIDETLSSARRFLKENEGKMSREGSPEGLRIGCYETKIIVEER
jgi:hypothetical protein